MEKAGGREDKAGGYIRSENRDDFGACRRGQPNLGSSEEYTTDENSRKDPTRALRPDVVSGSGAGPKGAVPRINTSV